MTMSPASGSMKPPIRLSVVVFPHPLGPSKEKNSPSWIVRLISRSATTSPYRFVTLRNSTAAFRDAGRDTPV